ncbi:MAG: hypothetical protein K6G74_01325 [Bacilli bacterium]|nr:hypothetical protein [Bacilli bacterium]
MKKKSKLVLLSIIPFLAGCFRFALDGFEGDLGPSFNIPQIGSQTSGITFSLSEGVDLTIEYGLYNKAAETIDSEYASRKYMFLTGNDYRAKEFDCLFIIDEPYEDCYWMHDRNADKTVFSKKVDIHLDSECFSSKKGEIIIVLAYVTDFEAQKEVYASTEIQKCAEGWYSFAINESFITLG